MKPTMPTHEEYNKLEDAYRAMCELAGQRAQEIVSLKNQIEQLRASGNKLADAHLKMCELAKRRAGQIAGLSGYLPRTPKEIQDQHHWHAITRRITASRSRVQTSSQPQRPETAGKTNTPQKSK